MTMKGNTQIPTEAIEGAAGINDKFIITASTAQIISEEKKKPTKKNTKTIIPNSTTRPVLSTDLEQGMSISVENGGKPVDKSR